MARRGSHPLLVGSERHREDSHANALQLLSWLVDSRCPREWAACGRAGVRTMWLCRSRCLRRWWWTCGSLGRTRCGDRGAGRGDRGAAVGGRGSEGTVGEDSGELRSLPLSRDRVDRRERRAAERDARKAAQEIDSGEASLTTGTSKPTQPAHFDDPASGHHRPTSGEVQRSGRSSAALVSCPQSAFDVESSAADLWRTGSDRTQVGVPATKDALQRAIVGRVDVARS